MAGVISNLIQPKTNNLNPLGIKSSFSMGGSGGTSMGSAPIVSTTAFPGSIPDGSGGTYQIPDTTTKVGTAPITSPTFDNPVNYVAPVTKPAVTPAGTSTQTPANTQSNTTTVYNNKTGQSQQVNNADLGAYTSSGNWRTTAQAPTNTQGVNGVGTSLFKGTATTLAGTQPNQSTQTAVDTSGNISTGNNLTPQQTQNQQNVNTGAQVSGNIAQNQTPEVNAAYQQLAQFNKTNPLLQANQANIPMAAAISTGRGQILGNELSGIGQGLSNTYNAAIQGEGQQLTGAQQQTQAGQNAQNAQLTGAQQQGNIANVAQGNQIQAQTSALNAIQPQLGAYGQTYYQPENAGNGGSGQVQSNDPFYATLQSYAKMAASGQMSGIPSSITGNAVLNAQMNQMAQQINPNYNPVTSAAQSQVTTQQTGQQAGYQSALQQGQNLQSQLGDLITSLGLNPNDVNAMNAGIQAIANNTSSTGYKLLSNYVNDIANTYSQILTPPGGSATDTSRGIASSMLDATAKGQSIIDVMKGLDQQAQAKIAGTMTSYGSSSGGSSTSGFGWNG
jgi:hypothetical protein